MIKNSITLRSSKAAATKIINNAPKAIIIESFRELAEQTNVKKKVQKIIRQKIREFLIMGGINVKEKISVIQNNVVMLQI